MKISVLPKLLLTALAANAFTLQGHTQLKDDGHVGKLSPAVKTLDAEMLSSYNNGAAIIGKGNTTALIDKDGNVIAAYGQYNFQADVDNGSNYYLYNLPRRCGYYFNNPAPPFSQNGLFFGLTSTGDKVVLNEKGKVIYAAKSNAVLVQKAGKESGGFQEIWERPKVKTGKLFENTVFVNSKGQKLVLKTDMMENDVAWGEGLLGVRDRKTMKYGFMNVSGQLVIPCQYLHVQPFCEGLAAVSKPDDTKMERWGFIDKNGKVVIPFKYAVRPLPFHNGLATVFPADPAAKEAAFIDRSDKVVTTVPKNYGVDASMARTDRSSEGLLYGYRFLLPAGKVMDSTAAIMSDTVFLARFGIEPGVQLNLKDGYDGQLFYRNGLDERYGIIDLKTMTSLPPVFCQLSLFDRASGLAYAKTEDTEGYINQHGEFVMVFAKKGK